MGRLRQYSQRQVTRTLAKFRVGPVRVEMAAEAAVELLAVEDPYELLNRMAEREAAGGGRCERFPYWAEVWPAAVGLSRWLWHHPLTAPSGSSILELGCGLGLVGIALAQRGWAVEATDFVEDALVFAGHNARRNGVAGRHVTGYLDWASPTGASTSCIVASDVLYEAANHPLLVRVLGALLRPGGLFLTSDPRRAAAQRFVDQLRARGWEHARDSLETAWGGQEQLIDVHVFRRPEREAAAGS